MRAVRTIALGERTVEPLADELRARLRAVGVDRAARVAGVLAPLPLRLQEVLVRSLDEQQLAAQPAVTARAILDEAECNTRAFDKCT